jgi:hypothetical protein
MGMISQVSLFQNPVGFETSSWKNRQKPGFSTKFMNNSLNGINAFIVSNIGFYSVSRFSLH